MNLIPSIHDTIENPIAQKPIDTDTRQLSQAKRKNKQSSLFQGDTVYLYGDRNYTGKLIHPVDITYPPKWTVQLDRGGYEAVNIKHISILESKNSGYSRKKANNYHEPDLEVPFSDSSDEPVKSVSELEKEIAALKHQKASLESENQAMRQRHRELEQENELLKKDLDIAKQVIRRAKDISPVMRLSLKRVLRLAHHACMDVQRTVGGWILRMGDKARKFRRLADIWDLISVDEFILSEIFPPEKLVAINLIQPPKRRERPTPPDKTTRPIMRPKDVTRNRTMLLVPSG